MGEAKRRKDVKFGYVDMKTGERGKAKYGGNIERYVAQMG